MDNPWASKDGMKARDLLGIQAPEGRDQLFWDEQEEDWSLDGPFEVISISPSTATAILNMHAIEWLSERVEFLSVKYGDGNVSVQISYFDNDESERDIYAPTLTEALIQAVLKEQNHE